jgi:serine/threonine-protein kinase
MNDTLTGKTIGKYEIIEKLGRGGMAEVYKGYQKNLDRYVAIKLMHSFLISEQDFLNRFQQEARAMAALNHPNIVGVYDFDQYKEDTYYLVMEFVDGGTLKDRLETLNKNKERLPLETSIRIVREVADALAYAHRRNLVHRDIKPANIMLDKESGRALLTDFGIVKLVGGQTMGYTATGALIGTPAYMSPEQALGKSGDERADIYSLGVLLFQMMTGQLPYEADTPLAVVMKHVNSPTPLPVTFNPEIPDALQTIIVKAMAKIPDDRYATAAELAVALRQIDLSAPPPKKIDGHSTIAATQIVPPEIAKLDKPVQMPPAPQATEVVKPPVSKPPVSQSPISQSPMQPVDLTTQPSASSKKRSPWLYAGIAAVLILVVVGSIFALNGRNNDPTPTIAAVVEAADTAAPETVTETPPRATAVPGKTPDVVATAVAAISLTETAKPTQTAVPTTASSPTPTPTPNATLDFLANCTLDVELVNSYAYQTQSSSFAPVSATFPMSWILRNSGTCPWPAGSQWAYVEGDELGYSEPVVLENDVPSGAEITLTTNLKAPASADDYESRWQLVDDNDSPIGGLISFSMTAYIPSTATPSATNTPAASPTPEPSEITELNYAFEIQNCEYIGTMDWRCRVRLTPYGGGGGPYTVFIFLNPIVELRDQFYYDYYVQARRCAAWNTEIRVLDEATSLEFSRHLYVDPNNYIAGGCTLP